MAVCLVVSAAGVAHAQGAQSQFEPAVGQPGKDVVWVPTPFELVEKMLDMASVTPQDFVVDLGSGDGRNVIAAAKRGAQALGVEYNPDMVELSKRMAAKDGVSDKATFVQGDMFEADFSKATVLALFLLPSNMDRLRAKFLDLAPGTRIVANTFGITGWTADEEQTITDGCQSWCRSLLWIVPAKVEGTWLLPQGQLMLKQDFQMISGTFSTGGTVTEIANGRLRGDRLTFTVRDAEYTGSVNGNAMGGSVKAGERSEQWSATRAR
jgi:SAM-dependent methyltransferase